MTPEQIKDMIETGLPDCTAIVTSDDNTHFDAMVVSLAFAGKPALQRHQMIYAALGASMGTDIHALSIKALTPEESAAGSG
jgi:acid stress-induced BolA-like protein IbaG/YrbA